MHVLLSRISASLLRIKLQGLCVNVVMYRTLFCLGAFAIPTLVFKMACSLTLPCTKWTLIVMLIDVWQEVCITEPQVFCTNCWKFIVQTKQFQNES